MYKRSQSMYTNVNIIKFTSTDMYCPAPCDSVALYSTAHYITHVEGRTVIFHMSCDLVFTIVTIQLDVLNIFMYICVIKYSNLIKCNIVLMYY